jgi:hypothetical protein
MTIQYFALDRLPDELQAVIPLQQVWKLVLEEGIAAQ